MKYLIIYLLPIIALASCTAHAPEQQNHEEQKSIYDSLEARCYERVTQTDSLRMEAQNFMHHTAQGTAEYFRARQFYINSYFNEKNYQTVLQMLDDAEKIPGYKDLPGTQADYLYTRSRCYQFTGRYAEAIATARKLMDLKPAPGDTLAHESIRTRAIGAMNNVNNIFYFTNRTAEGAEWFQRLRANPPALLKECCQRDLMIFEGYLRGLAEQKGRAEAVMDSARSMPIYKKTPENTFRDCAFAASVYYRLPHRQDEMVRLLKHAIAEGRKDRYVPGISWGMSLLGNIYFTKGLFQEAVSLQYQGLEIGLQQKDTAFCVRCFHELSKLYYGGGLYPQASHYIEKALKHSRDGHAVAKDCESFYLTKYQIAQKLSKYRKRERLATLASADSCFSLSGSKETPVILLVYKAGEYILHQPYESEKGLDLLNKNHEQIASSSMYSPAQVLKSIGLIRLGREAEARKSLLSISNYRNKEFYECLDTLMNHYLNREDVQAIAHLTKVREPQLKAYQKQKNYEAVVGANIKYQAKEKEEENQLLTAEVQLKNSRLQTLVVIGLALFIISACAVSWLWMRQHTLRLRIKVREQEKEIADHQLHEQSERLQQLINSRQELNNRNEELLKQLSEVQAAHAQTCDLDRVMESLQPNLLTNKEEEQFRIAFASLHPTVLHQLRTLCPRATRTDELICMLIVLKQTNEEMARTLGISRPSVLQNRYRLRSKLNLPEGSDFDTEVRRMLL